MVSVSFNLVAADTHQTHTVFDTLTMDIPFSSDTHVTEGGFYEMTVKVSLPEAIATGDAKGFIQKEVARHFAGCIADTGIPLGVGMWRMEFTNFMCVNFNFPEGTIVV